MSQSTAEVFKTKKKVAASLLAAFFCLVTTAVAAPFAAEAQNINVGLEQAASTGLTTVSLPVLVGRLIYVFLGLLGIVAVVLIIYAGFIWMTAQGNEEKIKKAKAIISNAAIGLIIIMSAFSIVYFILDALGAAGGGFGGPGTGGSTRLNALIGGRGTALGNGIIEYHYPESGQVGVPRNTRISVTFKKPLVLSTVFRNYDDNGTYEANDDRLCTDAPPCPDGTPVAADTSLQLNTDNVKIIPNSSLGSEGSGDFDERFANRYPDVGALVDPAPFVTATPAAAIFAAPQTQSIVIRPAAPIGSPTANMNYRVAFRGGEDGVRVWAESEAGTPEMESAFGAMTSADGAYYWSFETSTTIDTTPPKISVVVPQTTPVPGQPAASTLFRNQLLQVHFDEAVDPTTASGKLGAGGGFNLIDVQAQCLPGTYPGSCEFNGGQPGTVDGTFVLGNRYRTAEFTPDLPCEGVTENSCGEPVYCLPRNVRLEVTAKAATVDNAAPFDPEPPTALLSNGVVDMTGNSLDGNRNATAQGPQPPAQPGGNAEAYYINDPQSSLGSVSDTARWDFNVGSDVDLEVPILRAIDPPALPPESAAYPVGPSNVPVTAPIVMTWSKVMSVTSMRTGSFDETLGIYKDPYSTLVLRSHECAKDGTEACTPSGCPCTKLDAPGFYLGGQATDTPEFSMLVPNPNGAGLVSRVAILHPVTPFLTANDLGYTEEDIIAYPSNVPVYLPIARAKLKDDKQNCFWPSRYQPAPGAVECSLGAGQNSCCNRSGSTDAGFLTSCAPAP